MANKRSNKNLVLDFTIGSTIISPTVQRRKGIAIVDTVLWFLSLHRHRKNRPVLYEQQAAHMVLRERRTGLLLPRFK